MPARDWSAAEYSRHREHELRQRQWDIAKQREADPEAAYWARHDREYRYAQDAIRARNANRPWSPFHGHWLGVQEQA